MSRLFIVNGQQLKIHLESSDPVKVLRYMKFITNNGGRAVPQPDDDTIVLTDNYVHDTDQYPKFHINWLSDCIAEQRVLSIHSYLLTPPDVTNEQPAAYNNNDLPLEPFEAAVDPQFVATGAFSQYYHRGSSTLKAEDPVVVSDEDDDEFSDYNEAGIDEENSSQPGDFVSSTVDEVAVDESKVVLANNIVISLDSDDSNSAAPRDNNSDCQYNLRHSIHANSVSRSTSRTESSELSSDFDARSDRTKRKMSPEAHSSQRRDGPHKYFRYSEEENQKMINYLIENKAISKSLSLDIWKKSEEQRIFVKPYRTADALRCYFRYTLRYQIKNYTSDPKILKEFQDLFKKSVMRKARDKCFAESERKKMIEFLIRNNAISKALLLKTWTKMHKEKILVEPYRSRNSLWRHFCSYLLHYYANYTDDTEAIAEFEKLRNST